METLEARKKRLKKLVDKIPLASYNVPIPDTTLTKKRAYRIRRIAEPHLRPHTVKGKQYWYYCRGADNEIYLGDADFILMAVQSKKLPPKNGVVR